MPTSRKEARAFRDKYIHSSYWCGYLLGGCGAELTDRIGKVKVPHFAHHPTRNGRPHVCRRTNLGPDSADHLYIAKALAKLLENHKKKPAVPVFRGELAEGGSCTGLTLTADDLTIEVLLADENHHKWAARDKSHRQNGHGKVVWLLRPGSNMLQRLVERDGYVLLIKCISKGNDRITIIGVQTIDDAVYWTDANSCQITEEGIWTPHLAEAIHRAETYIAPGFPLATEAIRLHLTSDITDHGPVRMISAQAFIDNDSKVIPVAVRFRRQMRPPQPAVYELVGPATLDGEATGSKLRWIIYAAGIRKIASLPNEVRRPSELHLRDELDRLIAELNAAQRRNAFDETRSLLTEARRLLGPAKVLHQDYQPRIDEFHQWLKEATRKPARKCPTRSGASSASGKTVAFLAFAARRVLIETARQKTTVHWADLLKKVPKLATLTDEQQVLVFTLLDGLVRPADPMLTALVTSGEDRWHPIFRAVATARGFNAPRTDAGLRQAWRREIERAHAFYAKTPRPVVKASSMARASLVTSKSPRMQPRTGESTDITQRLKDLKAARNQKLRREISREIIEVSETLPWDIAAQVLFWVYQINPWLPELGEPS
ncbi:hypothetical protein F5972_10920 [Microbispora cellulosiformans]|uniref:Uncharacterized protein n=1 Tax=Microbispora cellulosiformans TaxID=2614688 RepID=A0A5J5K755_9ACTN|nr:hypothetical protein [Microbispora cellulosiformans]KAA9380107.1 hypothetical protein F5972_10920 [Microbispora cellulosiformans]